MKRDNIVSLIGAIVIVIWLIGMVLFINHLTDENKPKQQDVNGYLGYNDFVAAKAIADGNTTYSGYNFTSKAESTGNAFAVGYNAKAESNGNATILGK